jgi:excisionase family DNA binding protein
VALHAIERKLKDITEEVQALRYSLLAQDNAPKDTFALLAQDSNQFLTVEEMARLLNVKDRIIYGLPKQGLPAHKVGKELRFDPLEVAEWLKKRQKI